MPAKHSFPLIFRALEIFFALPFLHEARSSAFQRRQRSFLTRRSDSHVPDNAGAGLLSARNVAVLERSSIFDLPFHRTTTAAAAAAVGWEKH